MNTMFSAFLIFLVCLIFIYNKLSSLFNIEGNRNDDKFVSGIRIVGSA